MALTRQTMTDEQHKSVALEYLKAFDKAGVTSDGGSVLDLFAEDAQVYFPKWGLADGREAIGRLFADVGGMLKGIVHHYASSTRSSRAAASSSARGPAMASTRTAPGGPACPNGALVRRFRDPGLEVQRCFIYLDPIMPGGTPRAIPGSANSRDGERF